MWNIMQGLMQRHLPFHDWVTYSRRRGQGSVTGSSSSLSANKRNMSDSLFSCRKRHDWVVQREWKGGPDSIVLREQTHPNCFRVESPYSSSSDEDFLLWSLTRTIESLIKRGTLSAILNGTAWLLPHSVLLRLSRSLTCHPFFFLSLDSVSTEVVLV